MKKIASTLTVVILLFSVKLKSQITLESTYSFSGKILYYSEIMENEFKFILQDGDTIRIYNLDHSVYKKIKRKRSTAQQNSATTNYVFYISKTLFDCDSTNIEYLVTNKTSAGLGNLLEIYRENGDTLFMDSRMQLMDFSSTLHPFGFRNPIVQTPLGAKMLVQRQIGANIRAELRVYDLCGSLPTNIYPNSASSLSTNINTKAYPNPFNDILTIEYDLNDNTNGKLELFNTNGQRVDTFDIDNTFNNIRLDGSKYQSGNYYYTISTPKGQRITKKLIRFK